MAEAIGLAASIIAIVQFADRIVGICKLCIESLEDCPKDFRMILVEISSTRALFDSLHFVQQHDPGSTSFLEELLGPNGSITGCHAAIRELESLLPYDESTYAQGKKTNRQKAQLLLKTLAWPLKQNKAKELLTRIAQHKMTINTAFSIEVWQEVQDIKHGVSRVQETLTESQRHDICAWIQQNDPSSLHNIARELIEEGTCSWVVRLPEWYQWVNLHTRCLWIHGIPGCGKTVLAAHVIEETRRLCDENVNRRHVSVYYYCHHSRNMDELMPFLRWVVSQLCREAERVPTRLHHMHKRKRDPTRTELLTCLEEAVGWFDTVFIVIDALDESQAPWSPLLSLLQTLVTDTRFRKIQLLATSREYLAIQQTMTTISQPVSMANPYVERDIAIAVEKRIQSTHRFQGWPAEIRNQVIDRLSKQANGMFRWAICQLDILRHAGNIDEVSKALHSLPPTLDDTYLRIFDSVARHDWPLLRHVLQMIRFHDWLYGSWGAIRLSASLILEAYSARTGGVNQFYSVETLREICGCLVNFNRLEDRDFATFAHYTVREFVESDRILTGPVSYFALQESNKELAEFIFQHALAVSLVEPFQTRTMAYALVDNPHNVCERSQSTIGNYSIFSSSAVLYDYEDFIATDIDLSKLAYQFLNPLHPGFNTRCQVMRELVGSDRFLFRDGPGQGERFWDLYWNQPPPASGVGILTLLLWCSFFELATDFGPRIQGQLLGDIQLSLSTREEQSSIQYEVEDFQGTMTEFLSLYFTGVYFTGVLVFKEGKISRFNAVLADLGLQLIPRSSGGVALEKTGAQNIMSFAE